MNQRSDPIRTGIGVTHAAQSDGRPAFPLVIALLEPPAGIEPATPSLPWNHQEPLCGTPFPQVTPDRKDESYRFSSGEVMRSLPSHTLIVAGASHHPHQTSRARRRSLTQPCPAMTIADCGSALPSYPLT